jgi:hypothetical protein
VPTAAEHGGTFYKNITDPTTNTLFPNRTIPQSSFDALGKKVSGPLSLRQLAGCGRQ